MLSRFESVRKPALSKSASLAGVTSLLLCLSPIYAHAQTPAAPTQAASTTAANDLPAPDKRFVQAASMGNSTEIDASKLAIKQSYNSKVKTYARKMLNGHTVMTAQLKMATPHGDSAPKDNSDTALLDSLKNLKGSAFDKAYIQKIGLDLHQKAIAAFEAEARDGQVDDLKKLASKALPDLKSHYQMAKDLAAGKGAVATVD